MRRPFALLTLIVVTSSSCTGTLRANARRLDRTTLAAAEVDRTVLELMEAAHVPGLALAIINDGKVVLLRGYGWRDRERRLPMTEDTVFAGASFTKPAFGYAFMQLVDEGKVSLDRPVADWFSTPLAEHPSYRDLAGDARLGMITARMLLSHTSGLPNWRRLNPDKKLDLKADPGARYMYSGEGIALLQRATQEAMGSSFALTVQMKERVFDRFGMTRTSMVWQAALAGEAAVGYDVKGRPLGHAQRKSADAAGSMDTTVRDWAAFLCGVLKGDGLSANAREEMLSPQIRIISKRQFPPWDPETTTEYDDIRLSYGLGWGLLWSPYGKAFFKEGHDDGFQHYSIVFGEAGTGIVIMTNSDNGESLFQPLLERLIGDIFTPWRWENYLPYDQLPAGAGRGSSARIDW